MIMHVLNFLQKKFDYIIGARLSGFDLSVSITDAPIIVCEGDEYPASAIEKRPKFHFLFPHVAIITGIAWDHINVFPTFENYLEQFRIFINKIEPGGVLIYNNTDKVLDQLVKENRRENISYQPYGIPANSIKSGKTTIHIEDAEGELEIFGNHNLLNLNAAWYVCKYFKTDASSFVNAISNFTGASKRLEKIAENREQLFIEILLTLLVR
jgi:UDP-N-acetylmuramate: L-alanyl-gamma-D-glutamyl-meso-diaminopimelate ligase